MEARKNFQRSWYLTQTKHDLKKATLDKNGGKGHPMQTEQQLQRHRIQNWGKAKLKLSYLGSVENSQLGQVLKDQTDMSYRWRSLGFYADGTEDPSKVSSHEKDTITFAF